MRVSKSLLAIALGAVVAASTVAQAEDKIVVGFSQIGAESEWRTANTNDVKAAAELSSSSLMPSKSKRTKSELSALSSLKRLT